MTGIETVDISTVVAVIYEQQLTLFSLVMTCGTVGLMTARDTEVISTFSSRLTKTCCDRGAR